jgi:acetyl esterase/lipase
MLNPRLILSSALGMAAFIVLMNRTTAQENLATDYRPSLSSPDSIHIDFDVVYGQKSEPMHRADIYRTRCTQTKAAGDRAEGRRMPGVLIIHGGAWTVGDKRNDSQHAKRLAEHGFIVMSINYRLAPKHRFPAQLEDCQLAMKWMVEHAEDLGLDLDALGVWGYSAGGHLAALMATDPEPEMPRLRACVAGGAPCDLTALPLNSRLLSPVFGGTRAEFPAKYNDASPVTHVSADDPPMFLFHGTRDRLVPPDSSHRMREALEKNSVPYEYVEVAEKAHLMTFVDRVATEKSFEFLKKHLAK